MAVVVITGCTAGLGYHAALHLAVQSNSDQSFRGIVFACRNKKSAVSAAESIAKESKISPEKLIILDESCDLAEVESVRKYAANLIEYLRKHNLRIKTLVNNAGIGGGPTRNLTSAGYEAIFATNHLGHFLLTVLLLPFIDERIINVSSEVLHETFSFELPVDSLNSLGRSTIQRRRQGRLIQSSTGRPPRTSTKEDC